MEGEVVDVMGQKLELPERQPLTAERGGYAKKLNVHAFSGDIDLACLSIHQKIVARRR